MPEHQLIGSAPASPLATRRKKAASFIRRREVNLAEIDLNLLVALEALLSVHHVTIAAGCVGLSQPAMSRALRRLRNVF